MIAIHGGVYDYSKTIYESVHGKIVVGCRLHGDFTTTFSNHTHKVSPRGCPDCGLASRAGKRTKSNEDFFSAVKTVHGERYDYSKANYTNLSTKIEIICPNHGVFWQMPEKHKAGQICPECAGSRPIDREVFIRKCIQKHGDKYCYGAVGDSHFKGDSKVPITCKDHGVFWMKHSNHIFGQGCPKCAKYGFNTNKCGALYVLQDGSRVKVGITNRDIVVRLKEINKPSGNFKVVSLYKFDDGKECLDAETKLLKFMRNNYENTTGNFSGVTESFEGVDIDNVINFIKCMIYDGET